jgi:hypothetical protein
MVFVQVVHANFELYTLNVYLNNYAAKKNLLKPLEQWLIEMISRKPEAIFLVAGDFNCAQQPIQHFYELSLDEVTFRRVVLGQQRESRTDWVLCSRDLAHLTEHQWTAHSDHCVILSSLELPRSRPTSSHITLPQADVILAMC